MKTRRSSGNVWSMKILAFLVLAAGCTFAQVPAHSVISGVTIDVADLPVPVTYGAAETHAVLSACTANPVSSLAFTIDYDGATAPFYAQSWSLAKTDNGYCTSLVAPVERARILSLVVDQMSSVQILGAPAPSGTVASRAKKRN